MNSFLLKCLALFFILTVFHFHKSYSQPGQKHFKLKGNLSGINGSYIFFSYRGLGNNRIWDSVVITKGKFCFRGIISQPSKALLTTLQTNRTSTVDPNVTEPIFIGPKVMTISLRLNNFRKARLRGSIANDEFIELNRLKKYTNRELNLVSKKHDKLNELSKQMKAAGSDTLSESINELELMESRIAKLNDRIFSIDKSFFKAHPNSYITVFEIVEQIRHFSLPHLKCYYSKMGKRIRESEYGKVLESSIRNLTTGSPGSMASEFAATGIDDSIISLSDFNGHYLLIDFWASWCKPCRAGNPELKELYLKYNSSGIEFLGLADDNQNPDKWKEAISNDGIGMWKQALQGTIGDLYDVHLLPTKILIDPSGEIIGRYIGEDGKSAESLASKLKNIFGKK